MEGELAQMGPIHWRKSDSIRHGWRGHRCGQSVAGNYFGWRSGVEPHLLLLVKQQYSCHRLALQKSSGDLSFLVALLLMLAV